MTTTLTEAISLRTRALLVTLNISMFVPKKVDRCATLETLIKHNASRDSGAFIKALLPPESTKPVETAAGKLRTAFYSKTLPWGEGVRILPIDMWEDFSAEMRALRESFEGAVGEFLMEYSQHIATAQSKLGTMWNPREYPSVEEARQRFGVKLNWFPIAESADFRVDLPPEALQQVQQEAARASSAGQDLMRQDLLGRLSGALVAITEKLKDPDKVFRNSLIGNLKEVVEMLPKLNVLGDQELLQRVREAEKIASVDPDHLRDNPDVRERTRLTAEDVLRNMGVLAGRV